MTKEFKEFLAFIVLFCLLFPTLIFFIPTLGWSVRLLERLDDFFVKIDWR